MSRFVYLLAEGVHDVAFLGRVLVVCFCGQRVRNLKGLDEPRRQWLQSFKWPIADQIDRLSVPAPVVYRLENGDTWACLRSAEGVSRIADTLADDLDRLSKISSTPDAIGIILDSDAKTPDARLGELRTAIDEELGLHLPASLGQVSTGVPRIGVFSLPAPNQPGTLEDVLLPLGKRAYPALYDASLKYVDGVASGIDLRAPKELKELGKPAGRKKAIVGAMTAILKPGKATQVSIEDNRWISEETKLDASLADCLKFLEKVMSQPTSAPSPTGVPLGST